MNQTLLGRCVITDSETVLTHKAASFAWLSVAVTIRRVN